jgi:hypothetical protein
VAAGTTDVRQAATPAGERRAARGKTYYSPGFKAKALAVYMTDGPAAAARSLGIPQSTLKMWAGKAGMHTSMGTKTMTEAALNARNAIRERVRGKLLNCVDLILDDISAGSEARERKDNATAAAILLDKFRLEVGEPTGREEVRHDYSDRSDEDLIAEANAITREAAPHP